MATKIEARIASPEESKPRKQDFQEEIEKKKMLQFQFSPMLFVWKMKQLHLLFRQVSDSKDKSKRLKFCFLTKYLNI